VLTAAGGWQLAKDLLFCERRSSRSLFCCRGLCDLGLRTIDWEEALGSSWEVVTSKPELNVRRKNEIPARAKPASAASRWFGLGLFVLFDPVHVVHSTGYVSVNSKHFWHESWQALLLSASRR
jgi:hypothetical protein